MPTEPRKEAVEQKRLIERLTVLFERVKNPIWKETLNDAMTAIEGIDSDRQRWEQEVRERLEKQDTLFATKLFHIEGKLAERFKERVKQLKKAKRGAGIGDKAAYQAAINALEAVADTDLPAIFGEAEPVEDCETCGGKGIIHTGECREAMSGPTCRNPACPPCNTPETEPCPDCQSDGGER